MMHIIFLVTGSVPVVTWLSNHLLSPLAASESFREQVA